MADIKVKGYSGNEFEYQGVPKIWLSAPESTEEAPVLVPFTYGEAVENVPIALNLADGDQIVIADDGILVKSAVIKKPADLSPENVRYGKEIAGVTGEFLGDTEEVTVDLAMADGNQIITPSAEGKSISKVTITKPETLIPENIAKDVVIAGVTGTHEGGGNSSRNIFVKSGTYTATTSGAITVEHGLGTMPDIIIINALGVSSCTMMSIIGKSTELAALSSNNAQDSYIYDANILHVSFNSGVQQEDAYGYGAINMATPRTFVVGNSSGLVKHISGAEYSWTAIGGIVEHSDYFYIKLSLDGDGNLIVKNGVSAIEQIAIYIDGVYAKTVDYIHSEEFVVDISECVDELVTYTISIEAIGATLEEIYTYQYIDSVTGVVIDTPITAIATGECGTTAYWALYENGTMFIYGEGAMTNYSGASNQPWYSYASTINTVVVNDGITTIGNQSLRQLTSLSEVTLPETVTSIGTSAFIGCTALESIDLPDSLTTIGMYAFNQSGLTSINIPGAVSSFTYCFYGCKSLKKATISIGVSEIGYYAFHSCTALSTVLIGSSVTKINYRAFQGCSALTDIIIPTNVAIIGDNAFYGCSSLTSVTFNDTTTWAFYSSSTATSGKTIGSTSLANKATAAKYLTRTYVAYWWKKT